MENRIIKFRAWDVKKSRMIYFNACKRWGFINHELEPETTASFGGSEIQLTTNPEHYIWMQFTEYHGSNAELYHGDIVKEKRNGYIAVIEWGDAGFYFSPVDRDKWLDEWNFADDADRMEVIGNIWESPELVR